MTECLFCSIAAGEVPADIVFQDAEVLAFRDIQPQAPTHLLVIPRKHVPAVSDAVDEDREMLGRLLLAAARVAAQEGIGDRGFRLVVNNGPDAQQTVQHVHVHVIGGRLMSWPPG